MPMQPGMIEEFQESNPQFAQMMASGQMRGFDFPKTEGKQEHYWPKGLKLAAGVIDVKTPTVETKTTIAARLQRLASIDKINPNDILGGTDCGFETFANFGNVPYVVGLQKLEALAEGAALASQGPRLE